MTPSQAAQGVAASASSSVVPAAQRKAAHDPVEPKGTYDPAPHCRRTAESRHARQGEDGGHAQGRTRTHRNADAVEADIARARSTRDTHTVGCWCGRRYVVRAVIAQWHNKTVGMSNRMGTARAIATEQRVTRTMTNWLGCSLHCRLSAPCKPCMGRNGGALMRRGHGTQATHTHTRARVNGHSGLGVETR